MTTEAETIAGLARVAAIQPTIIATPDGRRFLIRPEAIAADEITDEKGRDVPLASYVKQAVTLQAKDSLADYVNRFKTGETLLFADYVQSRIVAIIDYHAASSPGAAGGPGHAAHMASLVLPLAEEWKLWTGISGKLMPQLDFARFVEENGADIVAPAGAELLEAVRDLQARRKVNFTKAVRTASDNESFEYADDTEARTRGGIELPTKFRLGLPVYFGEATTELYAFLRWRLDEGVLALGIQLHRAEFVRQAVFRQVVLDVGARTGCPVVFGTAG